MDDKTIIENINRHISPTPDGLKYFLSLLEPREFDKKDFLLREGQLCKFIYFVNEGAFRAFHISDQGKETTIMFAVVGWWITDMHCFVNEKPAMVNIEALEKSSVLQLSKEHWDKLLAFHPAFEKYFRILMQNAYTREQIRVLENLSQPASERYQNFLSKYPQIASQITQKQLASYLGITPEFLSAIRRQISQNKIS